MTVLRLAIAGMIGLFLQVGCKGAAREIFEDLAEESTEKGYDPNAPSEKFEVVWVEENKFQVPGEPEQYAEISVHKGTYQVTLHGMPEGSLFVVGDEKNQIESAVYDIVPVKDMTERFGKLEVGELSQAKLDPGMTAELRLPGKHAKIELPPARVLGLDDLLEKVENGPILFEGEKNREQVPKEPEEYSILLLSGLTPKTFGKASLLGDIDGLAVVHRLQEVKGTKTCSGYKDNEDKPVPDLTLELKETEVVVYDRLSGDVFGKKVFPPHEDCPMMAFGSKEDRKQDSSIPTSAIEDWVRSQVVR